MILVRLQPNRIIIFVRKLSKKWISHLRQLLDELKNAYLYVFSNIACGIHLTLCHQCLRRSAYSFLTDFFSKFTYIYRYTIIFTTIFFNTDVSIVLDFIIIRISLPMLTQILFRLKSYQLIIFISKLLKNRISHFRQLSELKNLICIFSQT